MRPGARLAGRASISVIIRKETKPNQIKERYQASSTRCYQDGQTASTEAWGPVCSSPRPAGQGGRERLAIQLTTETVFASPRFRDRNPPGEHGPAAISTQKTHLPGGGGTGGGNPRPGQKTTASLRAAPPPHTQLVAARSCRGPTLPRAVPGRRVPEACSPTLPPARTRGTTGTSP